MHLFQRIEMAKANQQRSRLARERRERTLGTIMMVAGGVGAIAFAAYTDKEFMYLIGGGLIVLGLVVQRWFWLLVFALGAITGFVVMATSIVHFEILAGVLACMGMLASSVFFLMLALHAPK